METKRPDPEKMFRQKYQEVLAYLIKHRGQLRDMSPREIHEQALVAARYYTLIEGRTHVRDINIGSTEQERQNFFRSIRESMKTGIVDPKIKRVINEGRLSFAGVAGEIGKQAALRDLTMKLRELPSEQLRAGLIKTLGMERTKTMRPFMQEAKRAEQALNTLAKKKTAPIEGIRDTTEQLRQNYREFMETGKFTLNPAFEKPEGGRPYEEDRRIDMGHINPNTTNSQEAHEMLKEIQGRYQGDHPYRFSNEKIDLGDHKIATYEVPENAPRVPLESYERQFMNEIMGEGSKFMDDDLLKSIFSFDEGLTELEKADRFRAAVLTAKQVTDWHLQKIAQDEKDLYIVKDILSEARRGGVGEVIKSKYADTRVGEYVLGQIGHNPALMASDGAVMQQMQFFLENNLFIGLHTPLHARTRVGRFLDEVNQMIARIQDRTDEEYYATTNLYRKFNEGYRTMLDNLRRAALEASSEYQGYTDFGIRNDKHGRPTLLDPEEKQALWEHTHEVLNEYDKTDRVAEKWRETNNDLARDRQPSKRKQLEQRILGEIYGVDEAEVRRRTNLIIKTIEGNAGRLKDVPKEQFADRLYDLFYYPGSPFLDMSREDFARMINQLDLDPANLRNVRAKIKKFEEENGRSIMTVFGYKEQSAEANRRMWQEAAYRGDDVLVPGRRGRHRIVSVENDIVKLKAEHVLGNQVRLDFGNMSEDTLSDLAAAYNEYRFNKNNLRDFKNPEIEQTLRNTFVQIVYEQKWVNEELRAQNEKVYERLRFQERTIGQLPGFGEGVTAKYVYAANLLEPYNRFLSSFRDTGVRGNVRLPGLMKRMIQSELPYMIDPKRMDLLASSAYMALADAVYSLHNQKVDLTDAGLARMWKEQGLADEEIEKRLTDLKGKGMQSRLDAFLYERARQRMYSTFNEKFTDRERYKAGESVVMDTHRILTEQYELKKDPMLKPTAANIRRYIQQANDVIGVVPFYREALRFNEDQIEKIIQYHQQTGAKTTSLEQLIYKLNRGDEFEEKFDLVGLDAVEEKAAFENYQRELKSLHTALDQGMGYDEIFQNRLDEIVEKLPDLKIQDYDDLEFFHDFLSNKNPHLKYIEGQVDMDGKMYHAKISRGNAGELMAYVPELNRTIPILEKASDADRTYHISEVQPRIAFGGKVIEEITSSGGVRTETLGDYEGIQRRGLGFTQANPHDTFEFAKQVLRGERRVVYLDMETTGLSGSTLKESLIQPLELFMRRTEWSTRKKDWYRVNGTPGIRENGRTVLDDMHLFIKPTDEVLDYARQLAAADERAFTFKVGERVYNGGDMLRMKAKGEAAKMKEINDAILSEVNGHNRLREIDRMMDSIWFMRNLAKYSGNKETFVMHIGAMDDSLDFSSYLKQLRADVQTAIANFEEDPATGQPRLFSVMTELDPSFNPKRARMITLSELPQVYMDFVGKDVIMGQNVSEADIKKFTDVASRNVAEAMERLDAERRALGERLYQEFLNKYDVEIGHRGGLGIEPEKTRYYQVVTGAKKMYGSAQLGLMDTEGAAGFNSPVVLRSPIDQNARYGLLSKNQLDAINNGGLPIVDGAGNEIRRITPDDIYSIDELFDDREEAIRKIASRMGGKLENLQSYFDDPNDLSSLFFVKMPHLEQGDERIIRQRELVHLTDEALSMISPEDLQRQIEEGRIIAYTSGMSQEERVNQAIRAYRIDLEDRARRRNAGETVERLYFEGRPYDEAIGEILKEFDTIQTLRDGDLEDAVRVAKEAGIDIPHLGDYEQAKAIAARLSENKPDVIEQMFMAGYLRPGMARNAEAMVEEFGGGKTDELHLAKTDVDTHLDINAKMLREASERPDFQAFTGRKLQVGDIIEHHLQADPHIPLGIYRVTGISDDFRSIQLQEYHPDPERAARDVFTLRAANGTEMDRKFQTYFELVDDPDRALREFQEDTARRQIMRAMEDARTFDRHVIQSQYTGITDSTTITPLRSALERRAAIEPGQELGHVERVLMDSTHVFQREDFDNLARVTMTASKRGAFEAGGGFYVSPEGEARKAFLDEVRAMRDIGVINDETGRELIRKMNESIKEAGRARGYTRAIEGKAIAGTMTDQFQSMAGDQMVLDVSSPQRIRRSLYSYAQRIVDDIKTSGALIGPDGSQISELEMKGRALNEVVFPFLRDQGLIAYDDQITLPEVIEQINARPIVSGERKRGELQQFVDYDYLSYQRNATDEEFLNFIRQKHEELLSPIRQQMTAIDQHMMEQHAITIKALKDAGVYDPNLIIRPFVDTSKIPVESININNLTGLPQRSLENLQTILDTFNNGTDLDNEIRKQVYSELFRRATAGRPNSVEGLLLESKGDLDRLGAAEMLGWIERNDAGEYVPSRNFKDMIFADPNYSYGDLVGKTFAQVPTKDIENILRQEYTEGNGSSLQAGLLEQWKRSPTFMEDRQFSPNERPRKYRMKLEEMTPEQRQEASVSPGAEQMRAQIAQRLEDGERAQIDKLAGQVTMERSADIDMSLRERPDPLRRFAQATRERVDDFLEGVAGEADLSGLKRGMKWVAGLGIAAFALKQFLSNGGPLKFERRPQGHGVESITGVGDNDDKDRELRAGNNPTTSGKAYMTTPNQGYTIRARAKAGRGVDHEAVTNEIQKSMGTLNVSVRDDREKMDRRWLEQQMQDYMTRGHLG